MKSSIAMVSLSLSFSLGFSTLGSSVAMDSVLFVVYLTISGVNYNPYTSGRFVIWILSQEDSMSLMHNLS